MMSARAAATGYEYECSHGGSRQDKVCHCTEGDAARVIGAARLHCLDHDGRG